MRIRYYFEILNKYVWVKVFAFVGFFGSIASVLSVDFFPDVPLLEPVVFFDVDLENLRNDEKIRNLEPVAEHPKYRNFFTLEGDEQLGFIREIRFPFQFLRSNIWIKNIGSTDAEAVDLTFAYYRNTSSLFEERFAGTHTIQPGGIRAGEFFARINQEPNFVEICTNQLGTRPFEKVQTRFLIPVEIIMNIEQEALAGADRRRWFLIEPTCHKGPTTETIEALRRLH